MSCPPAGAVVVRNTRAADVPGIIALCEEVYPGSHPWREDQIASHLRLFPEGQFVAVQSETQLVLGMAASLIVFWDDYEITDNWRDFTDHGMFTNHDPEHGHTLYGAEIMVSPRLHRQGIGAKLYAARRELVVSSKLLRIRAAARLRGYHRYAESVCVEEYVKKVVTGELHDPTLSFQLRHGFEVMAVIAGYLRQDPESRGFAAVIEWINPEVAIPSDYNHRDRRYARCPDLGT